MEEVKTIAVEQPWVIRKRGAFYRANFCGYTDSIYEAGIYSRETAEAEARIEPSITAHPYSEFAGAREEEIARVIKRERHRHCCTGAALDDVCATLSDEDMRCARAVLSLLKGGSNG